MFDGVSEFAYNLGQKILKGLYEGLYGSCENIYNNIFNTLNYRISEAAGNLGQSIESWNGGAFSLVRTVAENVCIPIAGCIIIFIFAWEMVRMCQDSNQMQHIRPDQMLLTLMKFAICLWVCTKSFEIVLGIYSIGNFAIARLAGISSSANFGADRTLNDIIPASQEVYEIGMIIKLLGVLLILCISLAICYACAVIIYLQVMVWFLEMLIFAVPASIPFATFFNKDWGQMGMNYTRKIMALGFQGFFMLLIISIYGGIVNSTSSSDFMEMMTMMCGAGAALIILLSKSGNISSSIFNAH